MNRMKFSFRELEKLKDETVREAAWWFIPVFILLIAGLAYSKYVDYREAKTGEVSESNMVCTTSMNDGACACIHRMTGDKLEMSQEKCRELDRVR